MVISKKEYFNLERIVQTVHRKCVVMSAITSSACVPSCAVKLILFRAKLYGKIAEYFVSRSV